MKTIEMNKASEPAPKYSWDVSKEIVVLTVGGQPVAALVPIENADMETVSLSTNPQFLALIERSRMRQDTEGGISSKEIRRRLGIEASSRAVTPKKRQRQNSRKKSR